MLNTIQDFVKTILPTKKKTSPSGWTSFNAVCCEHNGETPDRRGRGGIANNPDGSISYHCFNCNFKASYQPGRHLTYKFRKLLSWFGAGQNEIQRLVIEAIRIKDLITPEDEVQEEEPITFKIQSLPKDISMIAKLIWTSINSMLLQTELITWIRELLYHVIGNMNKLDMLVER